MKNILWSKQKLVIMSNKKKIYIVLTLFVFLIVLIGGFLTYRYYHYPVDLVYFWVDGSDKAWIEKKEYWQSQYGQLPENGTHQARFRQFDELKYSLRSVEKNLPWIRYIHIVTDGQVPSWLNVNHPKIKLVDHKDIFPKEALPVFNSGALEARLPYIPHLAEHFLYANDDYYVRVPLEKSFFFNKNRNPIVFARYKKRTYDVNLWLAQIKKAHELVQKKYPLDFVITPSHNMQAYRKSYFLDAISEYSEEFEQTTYSKFRQPTDINRVIVELLDRMKNRNEIYGKDDSLHFPDSCKSAYSLISRNFGSLIEEEPCLFCLNDFEGKTNREIDLTIRILNRLYPNKSLFEK